MKNYQLTFAKKLSFLLIFTAAIFLPAHHALAADGDLDQSFDADGKVFTDFGSNNDGALDAVLQPDGKIVLVGAQDAGSTNNLALLRYNADGSLDGGFGTGGKAVIVNNMQFGQATGAALQADGKIVIALGFAAPKVARVNADGSLDTTFGTNGFASVPATGGSRALQLRDVAVQSDGKILVCGAGFTVPGFVNGFGLVRLNQNGSADTTFGDNGTVVTNFPGDSSPSASSIDLTANGRIALGGGGISSSGPSVTRLLIAVYNPNGSLDTTFGAGGKIISETTENAAIESVKWQPDGRLIAGGSTTDIQGGLGGRGFLRRFTANGAADSSFGASGAVIIRANNAATVVNDIALQPDGKVLLFGQGFDLATSRLGFLVARCSANGTIDTSFATNGFRTTVFSTLTGDNAIAYAGFLQPDGKIVAAGTQQTGNSPQTGGGFNFAAARYLNTPGSVPVNNPALRIADFDGDGKTDASVFRNGTWFINPSGSPSLTDAPQAAYGVQFGLNSDRLVPADYDGDGKTDIAVWRAGELAYFYILNSSNSTVRTEQFGRAGDNPMVVGNWDADAKADLAVYRSGGGAGDASFFFYRPSSQPAIDFETLYWGTSGDEAVRGDFDGDAKLDAAVFRASTGLWYIRQSSNNQARYENWGVASDKRISGDFDGDGKTDFGVFRDGLWAIRQSSNNQPRYEQFGQAGDLIAAGDYDGDGKTDLAIFRSGVFYVKQSTSSQSAAQPFGAAGDVPIASALVQ